MRGEKRFAVLGVVAFGGFEEAIDPGKELLGAVVSVEDNWHAVLFGEGADVEGSGDRAGDCGRVVFVVETFPCIELLWLEGECK